MNQRELREATQYWEKLTKASGSIQEVLNVLNRNVTSAKLKSLVTEALQQTLADIKCDPPRELDLAAYNGYSKHIWKKNPRVLASQNKKDREDGKTLRCIKSLRKSTYKGLAFKAGRDYEVVTTDSDFIYIIDEMGHKFNFSGMRVPIYYCVTDYFR